MSNPNSKIVQFNAKNTSDLSTTYEYTGNIALINTEIVNTGKVGDNVDDTTKMMLERLERDSREREARYHADAREREQRVRERDQRIEQMIVEMRREFKEDFAEMKSEFKELRTDFKDLKSSTDSTNKWIIGLAITTIAAIVAIAAAIWFK